MFGDAPAPQGEQTPFRPRSPYAAAGETFVSRQITRAVAGILAGRQGRLFLGNLDARRDWGYAPEYKARVFEGLDSHAISEIF